MFSRVALVAMGLLAFGMVSLFGYASPNDDHGVLKRVTMEIIVNELTNRGLKVAFIEIPPDPVKGVTMTEEAKIIEAIPDDDRTWREKMLLNDFEENRFPATSIVGYQDNIYSIKLPETFPNREAEKDMLNRVAALDAGYELIWVNDFPVICPRGDPLKKRRIDLTLTQLPAREAVNQLGKKLESCDLNLMIMAFGPGAMTKTFFGANDITLKFEQTPLIAALCKFAEALGPNYTWSVLGVSRDTRNFGFSQVAKAGH